MTDRLFFLMPRWDGHSPRKRHSSLRALCPCLVLKHAAKSKHYNGRCCDVFIYMYILMFCKGTIFALAVGIIFVRGPELAVSAEQCVHWEAGWWKAKIGAISRLTGSSLCGFWNSSPVCSLSPLSVEIHGALCVQGYTGEGNTLAFFFFLLLNSSRRLK